jgi:hypothetical protein
MAALSNPTEGYIKIERSLLLEDLIEKITLLRRTISNGPKN